jgi:hypothetical protein
MRGRGPEGGIKGDVVGFAMGRARLDVATALAVGARAGAAPAAAPADAVNGVIKLAGGKSFARTDFLPAVPPVGVQGLEDILLGRIRLALLGRFVFLLDLVFA